MTRAARRSLDAGRALFVRRSLLLLVVLAVTQATASAHQLDEYMQAMLVDIDPIAVRLHLNLTPGVAIAEQVLAQIDRDLDGVISLQEADAYAQSLKGDLAARLDGRELKLHVAASNVPEPSELESGWGIIQFEFTTAPIELVAGQHKLAIENRHFRKIGAYLFNAARPSSELIEIVRQNRNDNQSQGEIEFAYHPLHNVSKVRVAGLVTAVIIAVAATAFLLARRVGPSA